MILMKWQTRVAYWNVSTQPTAYWWPDADGDRSTWWNLSWLWFTLERLNRAWVQECEDDGCDAASLLAWASKPSILRDGFTADDWRKSEIATGDQPCEDEAGSEDHG